MWIKFMKLLRMYGNLLFWLDNCWWPTFERQNFLHYYLLQSIIIPTDRWHFIYVNVFKENTDQAFAQTIAFKSHLFPSRKSKLNNFPKKCSQSYSCFHVGEIDYKIKTTITTPLSTRFSFYIVCLVKVGNFLFNSEKPLTTIISSTVSSTLVVSPISSVRPEFSVLRFSPNDYIPFFRHACSMVSSLFDLFCNYILYFTLCSKLFDSNSIV